MSSAQGRLVLSVVQNSSVGVIVNQPLAPEEDRTHTHRYSTSINFPDNEIAAVDCCNDQGARAGNHPISSSFDNGTSGLPFVQMVLCTIDEANNGSVPFSTVAFFDVSVKECPANWMPFDGAEGRFLIAGFASQGTLTSETDPLSSGEDRQHSHDFQITISTDDVSYVGSAGCCNSDVSGNGEFGSGVVGSDDSSTGLPYIQLLTCLAQEPTFQADFPPGALLFNEVLCPPGWTATFESAGRFIVGRPKGGVPGTTFGATSFVPGYIGNPVHDHQFSGSVGLGSAGVGLASGCCANGYAAAQTYDFQGTSTDDAVLLPYMALPMCAQTGLSTNKLIS